MYFEKLHFNKDEIEKNYGVRVNVDVAKNVVDLALEDYLSDSTDNFFNDKNQPEERVINRLIELEHGDKNSVLNALFAIVPFTFSGNTGIFFDRLNEKISDPLDYYSNCFLWNPRQTYEYGSRYVEKKALDFFQPLGHQKNALNGVYHNNMELLKYGGDIGNFFGYHSNNAIEIVDSLYVRPRAKRSEKEFWRFGPKLSILFLQWVDKYKLYPELKNIDSIGIPVDSQICKLAVQLGMVEIFDEVNAHNLSYNILLPMFIDLCREQGYKPRLVSEALWAMSSQGCNRESVSNGPNVKCPVKDLCKGLYMIPTDNQGKFYGLEDKRTRFYPWK